jgi:hypothetical protein
VQPFGGDAATHIIYSSIVTVDAELITLVRLLACSGKCAGRAAACERVDPSADRAIAEEGYVQVLVVRHAIAEQKEEFARTGTDDSQRPLTGDGRRKMRRGTAGLRAVVPTIDVLATSPLLRAVQTAEILAAVYNGRNMVTVKELSPDSEFPPFLRWLHAGCRRHGRDRGARAASLRSHELAVDWAQAVVHLPQEGCSVPAGVQRAAESRRSDARVGTRPVPASATRRIGGFPCCPHTQSPATIEINKRAAGIV